jgi:plasmid replication initiation protein
MVGENTIKDRSPLLPERRVQSDFFVCDIFDAAPKGDMASMEHPIFSIATKPDKRIRRYESGKNFVEITPSVKGLATVHDRDVLIFCISQIMAALNEEKPVSQTVRFKAFDLLTATNRGTDGRGYEQLRAAFERLKGTVITTNITTGNMEVMEGFGLIESFRIVRETREGRMQEIEVKLSDWVFNAIRHKEVLTLHRDYFRLRKPLERRIYELARKHCGQKQSWKIGIEKLQAKCGSSSTEKEFRRLVLNIVKQDAEHDHMPDYSVSLEGDMVIFINKRYAEPVVSASIASIRLDSDTYHDAKGLAPGWDVYVLEQEWRAWMADGGLDAPGNPDRAFLGFCKRWHERRGRP